jgi:hypothetical protein
MGLFTNGFPKYLPGLAVGVGVALAAPVVLVAAVSLLRPLAKAAIKGGFMAWDAAAYLYGAAASQVGGLMPQESGAKTEPAVEPAPLEAKPEPPPAPPATTAARSRKDVAEAATPEKTKKS